MFEPCTEFYLARKEVQLDEGGGRILLGDNTSDGAVVLPPIMLRCVGVLDFK